MLIRFWLDKEMASSHSAHKIWASISYRAVLNVWVLVKRGVVVGQWNNQVTLVADCLTHYQPFKVEMSMQVQSQMKPSPVKEGIWDTPHSVPGSRVYFKVIRFHNTTFMEQDNSSSIKRAFILCHLDFKFILPTEMQFQVFGQHMLTFLTVSHAFKQWSILKTIASYWLSD